MSRPPGERIGGPWHPGIKSTSVDPPKPRLNFKQVESNKVSITWTLYKSASSILGSLYSNDGTLLATCRFGGESRAAVATLGMRGTVYIVTIKPTYVDGTSATGRIEVWTSY